MRNVDLLQSRGGSLVMIAKGDRSQTVTDACKKHGGFYFGSIGGPAAILAQDIIKKVDRWIFRIWVWRHYGRWRSRISRRLLWWMTRG
jgi:tartrate dehydratase beta subunit/fumarate hydratase class I family protein